MDHSLGQLEPPDSGRRTIAVWIEAAIDDGQLSSGDRLPTVRELADHLDASTATVAGAYRQLLDRGVTISQGRRGTFVAPRPVRSRQPSAPTAGLIDLTGGRPDPDLLPDLAPVLAAIDLPTTTYGSPVVLPELAAAGSRLFDGDGVREGELVVLSGALDAIERGLDVWLRPGDAVAVEDPGWTATYDLVRAMRLRPVGVACDDHGMDPQALAAVVSDVAAVIVTPRYHNPTGAVVDEDRAADLRHVLDPHTNVLVIQDDHAGLIAGAPLADVAAGSPRWLHIQSLSKSLGPDLRVALARGDSETTARVTARQSLGPGWVSTLLQAVAAQVLGDEETPGLLAHARQTYADRRGALLDALEARGVAASGASGLNVWVPVPDEAAVVAAVRDIGVAVLGGQRFRINTPPAIRISTSLMDPELAPDLAGAIADALGRGPATSV